MSGAPTSQIAASIVQAVGLINQGQWGLAERVLGQVLGVAPREPDGLQLMGVVRAAQGRNGEAEALYRRSLAAKPKQPHVQVNLGKLLVGMGRPQDGIAMLRAVARANPAYVDALLVLGQAQQAAGDLAFAEKNLRAALKLEPGHASAILSLGALLNDASRPAEGEAVLRPALALDLPADLRAAIEQNLAVALKLQNRHGEALALFDAALRHAPGLPLADANRANTLQHLGRQEEAVAGYRKALAKDPLHLSAHQELNALLYRMGRDEDFLKSFDDAAVRAPEAALLWLGKGGFLNRTERFAEARDCFARAARAAPDNPEAQNGLALALAGLGELDAAVAAYETTLGLRPGDVPTRVNLAGTLLRLGEAKRALALTGEAVAAQPLDQGALAMHELALRVTGDGRADVLADYEKHVQVFDLDLPDGFNAELDAYLDGLHGDAREHIDQTLRHGTQTMEPLFDNGHPLVAALQARVEGAVGAYIARMDDAPTHPLAARRTAGFRFAGSWSSRLHDRGFHTNHIHPKGWISSCYYVAVPDAVEDLQQGWIKFGEPTFAAALAAPIRRAVKPAPGRLVLFPSYMWHGTVPFHSGAARTTIAFDAVPVPA